MIIIGQGLDMIRIPRIANTLERFGDRFTNRVYSDVERAKSDKRRNRAHSYAKRYAAKEACSKALGTGFRQGVFWRDMEVRNLPSGAPTMWLHNGAAARLRKITPDGFVPQISLTITDDDPWAQAIVLITAIPQEYAENAGLSWPIGQ